MTRNPRPCDRIWYNARLATMAPVNHDEPLGLVENGVVATSNGRIVWCGPAAEAPSFAASEAIDCGGRWITPGLIDCHSHIVHAGNRTAEFVQRQNGASYQQIAAAGGGIMSTVTATRAATEAELVASALPRIDALLAEGVTTIEIKSGYGLTLEHELKMLRAARRLGLERRVAIAPTFLAAHAIPPEYAGGADAYVDHVCAAMIPAVAQSGLADAVDGFCETIAFTPAQIDRLFACARSHGLAVKLHAEQLSNQHGAALAARHGALSADHLEYLDEAGVAALAEAGTVAVVLPGAFYFLRETQVPPAAALRAAGVPMAVATDCNPGTSPLTSLLTAMNMACVLFGLTPAEALAGVTAVAARALGRQRDIGTLAPGQRCDLAIWSVDRPEDLAARIGPNPLWQCVWGGDDT